MIKILPHILLLIMGVSLPVSLSAKELEVVSFTSVEGHDSLGLDLYHQLHLEKELDESVFQRAIHGLDFFEYANAQVLTIVDFSKDSDEKRLFVVDLKNKKLLYHCLVAHGKNSGETYAAHFSNQLNSLQSSPGFYRTAETYQGKHGYSLRLDGLETGINDQARKRSIVMHGANYVSEAFIQKFGRLGRSWGCPALPIKETHAIIDQIKNGSCLYIHTNNSDYLNRSSVL